jgi:hypothetical protein
LQPIHRATEGLSARMMRRSGLGLTPTARFRQGSKHCPQGFGPDGAGLGFAPDSFPR